MINTPSESIIFTDTQTAQLDELKKRLLNFEGEISIAQKNIKTHKAETEAVIKERAYQEELFKQAQDNTEKAKVILADIYSEIEKAQEILNNCNQETKLINDSNIVRASELKEREEILAVGEKEYNKKVENFTNNYNEFLKDKVFVETAKDAFLKALEAVK